MGTAEADSFLGPASRSLSSSVGAEVKAYPIQILIWHEIVNDEIAGEPVALTFCPLCNSTVAFEPRGGRRRARLRHHGPAA